MLKYKEQELLSFIEKRAKRLMMDINYNKNSNGKGIVLLNFSKLFEDLIGLVREKGYIGSSYELPLFLLENDIIKDRHYDPFNQLATLYLAILYDAAPQNIIYKELKTILAEYDDLFDIMCFNLNEYLNKEGVGV